MEYPVWLDVKLDSWPRNRRDKLNSVKKLSVHLRPLAMGHSFNALCSKSVQI